MRRSIWLGLTSILCLSLFMRTIPLFKFTFWGIDCGEYVYYTRQLIETGSIYLNIDGWGTAYPYFPGMFIIGGSVNLLTPTSIINSTTFTPILISSFVPLLSFVLTHKIIRSWKCAFLSSGFLTILAPFVYNYSQPKPETIGFFLMVLILTSIIVLSRKKLQTIVLILPSAVALVISHHLSTYFLILFVLGGYFFSNLARRKEKSIDRFRLYLYITFVTITILYWSLFAIPFSNSRLQNALGLPGYTILAIPYAILPLLYLIFRLRRKVDSPLPIKIHSHSIKTFLMATVPTGVIAIVFLLYSGFVNIPGRDLKLGYSVFIYMPLIILGLFSIHSRKVIKIFREGMTVIGWAAFAVLSLTAGIIFNTTSLLPMRHVSFLLLPISILFGMGTIQLHNTINPSLDKKKVIAFSTIVIILLAWSIPLAFPSQEMANGFQEGTEWKDLEGGFWNRGVDGKLATGHRLSASYFAVGNTNMTWTIGHDIFFSSEPSKAEEEIRDMNITYILWDNDMKDGTTTLPGKQPDPLDKNIMDYYDDNKYRVYSNGECNMYLLR